MPRVIIVLSSTKTSIRGRCPIDFAFLAPILHTYTRPVSEMIPRANGGNIQKGQNLISLFSVENCLTLA